MPMNIDEGSKAAQSLKNTWIIISTFTSVTDKAIMCAVSIWLIWIIFSDFQNRLATTYILEQRFLNYGSWFQMDSQSEMLGSQKFNSDILHQDLICYTAKNKHIRFIKTWFFFINFCILETNPKTTSYVYCLPKK